MSFDHAAVGSPTLEMHAALDRAFDHFNRDLFGGNLPPVMITLARHRKARGYFRHAAMSSKVTAAVVGEIGMNPDSMHRPVEATLSTLVHEMTHHWQFEFGRPSGSSHNAEWADRMDALGLPPTSTGEPGGKRTGPKMTHMIQPDGPFARSAAALLADGTFRLPWQGARALPVEGLGGTKASPHAVVYVCRGDPCLGVRGKAGLSLLCVTCNEPMIPQDPRLLGLAEIQV